MMELLTDPAAWIALLTLTMLELVLGIDNLVFIAILTDRLPRAERPLAYRLGLAGAMVTRIALLLGLAWVMHLTNTLFTLDLSFGLAEPPEWMVNQISGRDVIVLLGGLFLIGKSAHEIYEKVEVVEEEEDEEGLGRKRPSLWGVIAQIAIMDIIFSLDSVITAVGMVEQVEVMVAAIVIAVAMMLFFARPIGEFVNEHPSMKLLALSFMLLIGVLLVAEGFDRHLPKGYVYAAMGFALFVELLNLRFHKKRRRRRLRRKVAAEVAELASDE
ncbi:MAG TPA: TerC family protein [Sandaracinaceae bacterium LLY-WYZ-13_1]|nr:TerC family protein [Sandaracinaceae bacterium LLY-WYZ-13_1]